MKEDLLNEGVTFAKETINNFKSDVKERLKLPLLISYGIILVIYNWDVLYYLIFKEQEPFAKIEFIKDEFSNPDHTRFTTPFLWAIVTTFIFPSVQVLINVVFNIFKKINNKLTTDEEIDKANRDKKLIDIRSGNFDKEFLQKQIENNNQIINDLEKDKLLLQESYAKLNKEKLLIEQESRKNNEYKFNTLKLIQDLLSNISVNKDNEKYSSYKDFLNLYVKLDNHDKRVMKVILEQLDFIESINVNELHKLLFQEEQIKISDDDLKTIVTALIAQDLVKIEINTHRNENVMVITERGKYINTFINSLNI